MPTFTFGDSDNTFEILPAGEYPFEIIGADSAMVSSGKLAGSEKLELKVLIYTDPTFTAKRTLVHESLIFAQSCFWRIDTFVKAANLLVNGHPPRRDDAIELTPETVVGLRGWCRLKIEEYDSKKTGKKEQTNRVDIWMTDKPKLAAAKQPDPDDF